MSLEITFQKEFTIEDVENKTSIQIEEKDGEYWMVKNNSSILIKSYVKTQEELNNLKKEGFEIIEENGKTYISKDGNKGLIRFDKGKKNVVDGLSKYGQNSLGEIMNELVLTFQTKFITDNEEEMFMHDNNLDSEKLFDDATKSYGYRIENGVISL
jgi:hypothetical protein